MMNMLKNIIAITALSASAAIAGNPLPAPVAPSVPTQLQQFSPSCVDYIPNIVLWDHGTNRFIRNIETQTTATRRQATLIARKYCRSSRLGHPDPYAELLRDIALYQ